MAAHATLEEILGAAAKRADHAEVYERRASSLPVEYTAGKLESVKSAASAGRALRVIKNGRVGYAATTDLADKSLIVDNALASAQEGDEVALRFPGPASYAELTTFDDATAGLTERELIAMGGEAVERIRAYDATVDIFAAAARVVEETRLMNTAGLDASGRNTYVGVDAGIMRAREGDILLISEDAASRRLMDVNAGAVADKLISRLKLADKEVTVASRPMPVVLSKSATMLLFNTLVFGFNGRNVHLGSSPLKGKLGEAAFDRRFDLTDDALFAGAPRSYAVDDEGTPTTRRPLVADGVVKSFLYDLTVAALAGAAPTGNGFKGAGYGGRNAATRPGVNASTWVVRPGDKPLRGTLAAFEEALVVDYLMGLATGVNVFTGDFSLTAGVAFLARRGEIAGRVKNTMIAGNVYELLREQLVAVGDEPELTYDVFYTPPLVFDGVSVVTKG